MMTPRKPIYASFSNVEQRETADAWWFLPTLKGLTYRRGDYPGAGWLPVKDADLIRRLNKDGKTD